MTQYLLIKISYLLISFRYKICEDYIEKLIPTAYFLEMHLRVCMIRRIISTVVSIQIHLD